MKIGENRLYFGGWKNGKMNGLGFMIYIDKGIFDGIWIEGMR